MAKYFNFMASLIIRSDVGRDDPFGGPQNGRIGTVFNTAGDRFRKEHEEHRSDRRLVNALILIQYYRNFIINYIYSRNAN